MLMATKNTAAGCIRSIKNRIPITEKIIRHLSSTRVKTKGSLTLFKNDFYPTAVRIFFFENLYFLSIFLNSFLLYFSYLAASFLRPFKDLLKRIFNLYILRGRRQQFTPGKTEHYTHQY